MSHSAQIRSLSVLYTQCDPKEATYIDAICDPQRSTKRVASLMSYIQINLFDVTCLLALCNFVHQKNVWTHPRRLFVCKLHKVCGDESECFFVVHVFYLQTVKMCLSGQVRNEYISTASAYTNCILADG